MGRVVGCRCWLPWLPVCLSLPPHDWLTPRLEMALRHLQRAHLLPLPPLLPHHLTPTALLPEPCSCMSHNRECELKDVRTPALPRGQWGRRRELPELPSPPSRITSWSRPARTDRGGRYGYGRTV